MSAAQNVVVDNLHRWRLDPVAFVRECFGITPEPWQAKVLQDIAQPGAHVAVRSGHGVGKSALDAWCIIWFLLTHYPVKIPCTAPSAHQLQDVLWAELAKWIRRLPSFLQQQLSITSEKLELAGGRGESFAVARTARPEKPEALQGFHSENMLFVLDEASGIEDIIFEVAQGALSTPNARVLMTANPTRTSGYFYDAFHKLRASWKCHRVSCHDSSQVAPKYANEVAIKFGKDSNVYRVRVLGEFPESDDDSLIRLHLVESALDRDIEPDNYYRPIWGFDVARFGSDRCALAKRRTNTLLEPVKWWAGNDIMQSTGRVVAEYKDALEKGLAPSAICVDVIGIGAGVVDRLKEQGLPVKGVNVGESAMDPKFMRLRDELWWKCREWFEARSCRIPKDDELISELTDVKYRIESSGKLRVEPKEEMKKRGLRSPDLADALCLTFASQFEVQARQRYEDKPRRRSGGSWMSR